MEDDALVAHLLDAALDDPLLELEVGNAVHQEPADPIGALEDLDRVPGAVQLSGRGEAGRSGADHGDALAGALGGHDRHDPALFERVVDDLLLDLLDRDRVVVDAEHAGFLARRRADPSGELGEVVGRVQPVDRVLPAAAVHEVVPVGDDVPERAALVTEGNAAIHAARALLLQLVLGELALELVPVLQTLRDRPARRQLAAGSPEIQ